MDGGGAAEGRGGAFGEAEVVGLVRADGFGHGGDDGFDGDGAVDAVAGKWGGWSMWRGFGVGGLNEPVPEIDVVGLQLSQTLINGVANVVRLIGQDPGPVW